MLKSESIKELATALCAAQRDFPLVPFNAVNPFLKNKYADLGSVIETAKPILARNGLSVSQLTFNNGNEIGVTTILMHSSGESIESSMALALGDEKGKSLAQVAGSIITYLRRYAYSAILGLYADEDTDGDNGNAGKKKEEKKPAETLAQSKARLAAAVKDLYPDGAAIGKALTEMNLKFELPTQYEIVLAKLREHKANA